MAEPVVPGNEPKSAKPLDGAGPGNTEFTNILILSFLKVAFNVCEFQLLKQECINFHWICHQKAIIISSQRFKAWGFWG